MVGCAAHGCGVILKAQHDQGQLSHQHSKQSWFLCGLRSSYHPHVCLCLFALYSGMLYRNSFWGTLPWIITRTWGLFEDRCNTALWAQVRVASHVFAPVFPVYRHRPLTYWYYWWQLKKPFIEKGSEMLGNQIALMRLSFYDTCQPHSSIDSHQGM